MNKKRVFILLLMFLIPFIIPSKAFAAESIENYICSSGTKGKLIDQVSKIKLSYDLIDDPDETDKESGYGKYFTIKVTNFSENLSLQMGAYNYQFKDVGESFTLKQRFSYIGGTIKLKFFGGDNHPCYNQFIASKTIKLPKFNTYSLLDECVEYEEFSMCNKFYDGEIESKEFFLKKLEEYKKNIKGGKQKREGINVIDRVMSFIEDHQLLTAIVAIVIGALIIFIVVRKIRRRMKRTKIKM